MKRKLITAHLAVEFAGFKVAKDLGLRSSMSGYSGDRYVYAIDVQSALYPNAAPKADIEFLQALLNDMGLWSEYQSTVLGGVGPYDYPGLSWQYALSE